MIEVDAAQAQRIRELVAGGLDPDEAYRKVTQAPAVKKSTVSTMPSAKKKLEAWLDEHWPAIHREHRFHPKRRWRFDYYLSGLGIAVEYDGLMKHGANQGHASIGGILADVEKYNAAQAADIRVFRANAKNIEDGSFFALMEQVIESESAS